MMVQNRKLERICIEYTGRIFKPIRVPMKGLEITTLTKEEITAIYYADFVGLKQNEAAEKMGISQASFSRDLNTAHKKIASALFHEHAIQFEPEPLEKTEEND